MQKLRTSICGKKGNNLDDLVHMTSKLFEDILGFYFIFNVLEFCHTGHLESLNSLLLKYANKTYFYR